MKKSLFSSYKNLVLLLSLGLAASEATAQQIPFYSQYYINPFIYNPAFTGTGNTWNTYLIHRTQWADFPGAPVTNALTLDGPIKDKKIGVGISLFSDQTDITSRVGAYASYSYRMDINPDNRLFLGISGGVLSNQIDFTKARTKDPGEASIANLYDNKTTFDANFGANYQFKQLQVGFSMPQLLASSLQYINSVDARSYYNLRRHYLGTLQYTFDINKQREIVAYPLILARFAPNVPMQFDFNLVIDWKKNGWFAVSYKDQYAMTFNLGLRFNGLSVGYAYDVLTGPIAAYTGPSSEILIGYSFKSKATPKPSLVKTEKKAAPVEDVDYDAKIDNLAKKVKDLEEQNDTLQSKLNRLNFSKGMVPQMNTVYRLDNVNFDLKSFELNKKSRKILDELVEFLVAHPNLRIDIQGHTDDIGEPENNQILSDNRAKAVFNYLVEKGINSDRLSYKGFGETQPLVPGHTDKARAVNRRTEFIITAQ